MGISVLNLSSITTGQSTGSTKAADVLAATEQFSDVLGRLSNEAAAAGSSADSSQRDAASEAGQSAAPVDNPTSLISEAVSVAVGASRVIAANGGAIQSGTDGGMKSMTVSLNVQTQPESAAAQIDTGVYTLTAEVSVSGFGQPVEQSGVEGMDRTRIGNSVNFQESVKNVAKGILRQMIVKGLLPRQPSAESVSVAAAVSSNAAAATNDAAESDNQSTASASGDLFNASTDSGVSAGDAGLNAAGSLIIYNLPVALNPSQVSAQLGKTNNLPTADNANSNATGATGATGALATKVEINSVNVNREAALPETFTQSFNAATALDAATSASAPAVKSGAENGKTGIADGASADAALTPTGALNRSAEAHFTAATATPDASASGSDGNAAEGEASVKIGANLKAVNNYQPLYLKSNESAGVAKAEESSIVAVAADSAVQPAATGPSTDFSSSSGDGDASKKGTDSGRGDNPGVSGVSSFNMPKDAVKAVAESNAPLSSSRGADVYEKLNSGVKMSMEQGGKEVRLTLHPDHLGQMSIKISVDENNVKARITVENADVKNILTADAGKVREIFTQNGMNLDKYTVDVAAQSFNMSAGGDNAGTNASGNGQTGNAAGPGSYNPVQEAVIDPLLSHAAYYEARRASGGIDVFI